MLITIKGICLEPLFQDGQTVEAEEIRWHEGTPEQPVEIRHDDIIMADLPGYGNVVKIIRALPGDTLAIVGETITINGDTLRASDGTAYEIDAFSRIRLDVYSGTIREGYLFMSNVGPGRDVDSRRFGLVSRNQIIARIITEKKHGKPSRRGR